MAIYLNEGLFTKFDSKLLKELARSLEVIKSFNIEGKLKECEEYKKSLRKNDNSSFEFFGIDGYTDYPKKSINELLKIVKSSKTISECLQQLGTNKNLYNNFMLQKFTDKIAIIGPKVDLRILLIPNYNNQELTDGFKTLQEYVDDLCTELNYEIDSKIFITECDNTNSYIQISLKTCYK